MSPLVNNYGDGSEKSEMLSKAILIATLAHEGQFDKGGKPYILHPLTVLHKVGADDEEVQCAAVLHDVIEDCTGKTIYIGGQAKVISFAMLLEKGDDRRCGRYCLQADQDACQTYEEYQAEVLGSVKAMLVKREDLRTNSDLRRLKSKTITEKDVQRVAKYMTFYAIIEAKLGS